MNFTSLPLALLLLLPGFLLLHLVFLVSRIRRVSAFYASMWSLLCSLVLVGITYPIYTVIVSHPQGTEAWPGLLQVLADPTLVPGPVWILLYVAGVILGWGIGHLERRNFPEWVLRFVAIDVTLHDDLWGTLLRERDYSQVQVYLKDGSLLAGWPERFSNDRAQPGPEIYLSQVRVYDPDMAEWKELEGIKGILLHGSEISRIEFQAKPDQDKQGSTA